jgi:diguanylate cyclase (GGDEF)-like protein/PAS domain S-box-containing protein
MEYLQWVVLALVLVIFSIIGGYISSLRTKISKDRSTIQRMTDNIHDVIFVLDMNLNYTYVSPSVKVLRGYEPEDVLKQAAFDAFTPSSLDLAKRTLSEFMELGKLEHKEDISRTLQLEIRRKDGTTVWTETNFSFIRDKNQRSSHILGVMRDITERKQMEESLRQSEEKHRNIIETIQEGYFEVDLTGNFTFFNDSICRILGYPPEEMMGMNNQQYTDKDYAKRLYELFAEVYRTGESAKGSDWQIIRKDGTKRIGEVFVSLQKDSSGNPIGFSGTVRDATERKTMEEALRQNEERYRTILDEMADAYFEVDVAGNYTFVNDAVCRHLGYPREELIGTSFRDQMAKEELDKVYKAFGKIYMTGKPERDIFYKLLRKDGTTAFAELAGFPLQNQKGEVIGFRGVGRDITERKQMEEALRQGEEKYRTILESIQEGYFEVDLTGNFTFCNDSMSRLTGHSKEELLGMNHKQFTSKETAKEVFQAFNKVYATGEPSKAFDWQVIRKDGVELFIETSITLQKDSSGKPAGFKGMIRDITEHKRIEQQIHYMATHDALTGLPNRLMFSQLLNQAIRSAQRNKRQLAVFFIDLDRFKTINDSLGHEAGDRLLKEIARRFKKSLRAVDVVGRLGGDEFVIFIEEVKEFRQVEIVAHKILSSAIKPMVLQGEECRVTASIGISIYPKDGEDDQSLIKNADMAMYFAKEEGKNNYQFYSKDIQSQSNERFSIETNLRLALERK